MNLIPIRDWPKGLSTYSIGEKAMTNKITGDQSQEIIIDDDHTWLSDDAELPLSNRTLRVNPDVQKINAEMQQTLQGLYEQGLYADNQGGEFKK